MMLSRQSIKKLIEKQGLVKNFVELENQLQQSGIDITLEKVYKFENRGTIDFDNSERKFPETKELGFDNNGFVELKNGAYKVMFNEVFNMPKNIAGIARTRSSLLRMGATIETGLWDPGFSGKAESLLLVQNSYGIRLKKNAKLLQVCFVKLDEESEKGYEGIHKNIELKEK